MQPEPHVSPRRAHRHAHAATSKNPAFPVRPAVAESPLAPDTATGTAATPAASAADLTVSSVESAPALPTRRSLRQAAAAADAAAAAQPKSAGKGKGSGRRRPSRPMFISTAIVATGILVGSGFVVHSTVSTRVAADAAAASAAQVQAEVTARVSRSKIDAEAQSALSKANAVVELSAAKVDTAPLVATITSLANYTQLDNQTIATLTDQTETQAATVKAAADEADRVAAEAAAAAAAKAAADAAAAAEAAAQALAEGNTVAGAKATAERLASSEYGWDSSQFSCLVSLWSKESGWSYEAYNAGSGATGIPQALPGSKMASIASDWETNATTQILWGLKYIKSSYGSPCSAWSHSQSVNWY